MDDIKRVFFHELGHFIAHELNARHFNGGGVIGIEIYPSGIADHLYSGHTKINLGDRPENAPPEEKELPETLAALAYGCFFQAYFENESFTTCMSLNGDDDTNLRNVSLLKNSRDHLMLEIERIDNDYLDKLKQNRELQSLLNLDPYKYLNEVGPSRYEIDMDKLRKDSTEFLEEHKEIYQSFVKSYSQLFEQDDLTTDEQAKENVS